MEDSLPIQTTQNVRIDYVAAGLGNRILATLLDIFIRIAYSVAVLLLLSYFNFFDKLPNSVTSTLAVLIFLPVLLYSFLFETFMEGQTPGKKIVKIKVVMLDGTQPAVGAYFLRWVIRILDIDIFSGIIACICISVSDNKQRIGDIAAGTTVIRMQMPVSLKETILENLKPKPDYTVKFPQVAILQESEIELLQSVLQFNSEGGNPIVLTRLCEKIKTKTGIHTTLTEENLIKTLIHDYKHISFQS